MQTETDIAIRVVMFQDNGKWVAQCLEYDIGVQADDIDTLNDRLKVALKAEMTESMERHGVPFEGIEPAPQRFQNMWEKRARSRDLYPVSDIRFVLTEIGKLTANVDRLIADVKGHGEKIDGIRHQATFIKGGLAVGVILIGAFIAIASFFLSAKWDAVMLAVRAVTKP